MGTLGDIGRRLVALVEPLQDLNYQTLRFWHGDAARTAALVVLGIAIATLVVRSTLLRPSRRQRVGLPALLAPIDRPSWSFIRHLPMALFAGGLISLAIAVADPYSSLAERSETFTGRRICLMIDASSSMTRPFAAPGLRAAGTGSQAAFFTSIAAADRFLQLRTGGPHRDLMALVEFGDQAYVVTPFTTDYDNIRLSLSLIGDFGEYVRFPDQGTLISRAIDQGVGLFEAFDFLDAAGNIMIIFSDGEDAAVVRREVTVEDVVRAARNAEVPIYFIRTRYGQALGSVVSDAEWKAAVERTGGRFYAALDESSLVAAIRDIDRASAGQISITQYASQRAEFVPFALLAAGLWSLAVALTLAVPAFRRFP